MSPPVLGELGRRREDDDDRAGRGSARRGSATRPLREQMGQVASSLLCRQKVGTAGSEGYLWQALALRSLTTV